MSGKLIGSYVTCDDALCVGCFDPDEVCDTEQGGCGATYGEVSKHCARDGHWEGFESWGEPACIFDDTEADTPTHCVRCHELIPHALTSDGYRYVEERAREHIAGIGRDATPNAHSVKVVSAWLEEYGSDAINGIVIALHDALYDAMNLAGYLDEECDCDGKGWFIIERTGTGDPDDETDYEALEIQRCDDCRRLTDEQARALPEAQEALRLRLEAEEPYDHSRAKEDGRNAYLAEWLEGQEQ